MKSRIADVTKVGFYISVLTITSSFLIPLAVNIFFSKEQESYNDFYYDFPMFVLFSPILESLLSILILRFFIFFISQKSSCIALGLVWAGLHSTMGTNISNNISLWLLSFISFYLYGWLYFKYHSPSLFNNIFVVTLPHSLHNLYVYFLICCIFNL